MIHHRIIFYHIYIYTSLRSLLTNPCEVRLPTLKAIFSNDCKFWSWTGANLVINLVQASKSKYIKSMPRYAQLHFSNHHELPELSPPVPARSLFDSTAPHFPPALPMKSAPLAAKAVALTRRDQQNRYLGWWTAWQHLRVGFQSPPCLLTHSPTKTTMHLNPNPRAASVQSFQHDRLLELIKCRPHWSDIHSSLGGSASHDTSDPRRPASPSSWV